VEDFREYRIFGPPGTGKTSYLSKQIIEAVKRYGPENILAASFTKAAAAELVRRNLPIPPENIGTLHALCYRELGRPLIAEMFIEDFNQAHPEFALSPDFKVGMDEGLTEVVTETRGDKLFLAYQILRHQLTPANLWPKEVQYFFKAWERWKTGSELIDFTDMIAFSLLGDAGCPGGQAVGFFDEVQDFTPLELAVVRRWSASMDRVLLAGDDDQCLYSFKGATPYAFLEPDVPKEYKRVLSKSWRVPEVIHAVAEKWIRQVGRREPKEYRPRDEKGELRELDANTKTTGKVLRDAEQYLKDGKTVMILVSCSYMLQELQARLREQFIPFHNPYRKSRADWNPLMTRKGAVTMRDRIASFLRECEDIVEGGVKLWTIEDLHKWTAILKAGGNLVRGSKAQIEDWADSIKPVLSRDVAVQTEGLFEPEAWRRAKARDLKWYGESIVGSREKAAKYPIGVALKHGLKVLEEKPKIVIGTIHSVKGGEADVVYLFPDLSLAGAMEWARRGEGRDAIIRQFYVGMTRAKESLIVCKPATRTLYVPLQEVIR